MLKNKPFSIFFFWIVNNWEFQPEQLLKISKSRCESEKTWGYSQRPTLKDSNFESTNELGKVRS